MLGPPRHIKLMLNSDRLNTVDLSSVRIHFYVGSKVSKNMIERWNQYLCDGISAHNTYAMTEMTGHIAVDYPGCGKNNVVGQLVDGFSIKIIDQNGNRCGPNVSGKICIKKTQPFAGYFGNDKTMREPVDSEGFYLSDDIGYFDDDGDLFVDGRTVDMLKHNETYLLYSDFEDFLVLCAGIDSVCIVGISNGTESDLPAAVIIRSHGSKITEQNVFELIAGKYWRLITVSFPFSRDFNFFQP